ncbi:MAG: hypothetical protein Q9165_001792 [Trypethelium subeluteriae]
MAITLEPRAVAVKPPKAYATATPLDPEKAPEQPIEPSPSQLSPLLRLPPELRHKIYRLALTDSEPFVDPCIYSSSTSTIKSPFHSIPSLALNLLRTCRQIHAEATSLGCLHRENVFQFTTVTHCHSFLSLLGPSRAHEIHILSINLRLVAQGDATTAHEWLAYTSDDARGGLWTQRRLGTLRADLPNLRCVRLDLSGWCRPGYGQHRWEYFRSIARGLRGLECVAVGGEVKLRNLDLAVWEPWAPELFLTNNVIDRREGMPYGGTMVDLMASAVLCDEQGEDGKKKDLEVRWSIANGKVLLEVLKRSRTAKRLSAIDPNHWTAPWTESYRRCPGTLSSSCTWEEYEKQVNTYKPSHCDSKNPVPEEILAMAMNGYLEEAVWSSSQSG